MMDDSKLVIGVHYEPSGIDPHINAAELGLQMTMGVFDTLVYKTDDGRYLPGLAERFEISDDETTYRFYLRSDVKFHDGTAFNAAAVKFSLDRAVDPANRSQLAGSMLGPFQDARVLDDYTVEVQLAEPYGMLLDSLSQGWLAPVSPAAVEKYGDEFCRHPVGTGPFVFESWEAGKQITLERNPEYGWGPTLVQNRGPAHLEKIVFPFLANEVERTAALEDGRVSAVYFTPAKDVDRLQSRPDFEVTAWPIRGIPVCMMMNTAKKPTNELAVRRAINFAVDADNLVEKVYFNKFVRAYGPLSQSTLGYESAVETMYPYDLAKARQLLDDAGWHDSDGDGIREKDGEKLQVEFYALPVNNYPEFGELVTQQLGKTGIQVIVKCLHPVEWIRAGQRGDHHLIPQGKYASSPHMLSYVYHSRFSQDGYGWSKRTADHRPGFDDLLDRGEKALRMEDFIPIYKEVQRIVMEEALVAPLHCNTNIVARRKEIQGFRFDATGAYPYFHDTRIEPVK